MKRTCLRFVMVKFSFGEHSYLFSSKAEEGHRTVLFQILTVALLALLLGPEVLSILRTDQVSKLGAHGGGGRQHHVHDFSKQPVAVVRGGRHLADCPGGVKL